MTRRPIIAVSSCLLGQQVRYDAEIKHFPSLLTFINLYFEPITVCPEVEIGLSVPRPPVQLMNDPDQPQMVGRDDPGIDITAPMQQFCEQRPLSLQNICGYIFKSRSPSCGIHDVPVFDRDNHIIQYGSGLFARAIHQHLPNIPMVDETELVTERQQQQFLQQVLNIFK
ncbi:MAG: DUF523 domain-containing protein [Gammaproteobacteria bacterium]